MVIPCTFEYHCDHVGKHPQFNGVWATDEMAKHIVYSSRSTMPKTYEGRTHLLGNLTNKACDLRIDNLTELDQGPFYFRIESDKCNYTFSNESVRIELKGQCV